MVKTNFKAMKKLNFRIFADGARCCENLLLLVKFVVIVQQVKHL